MAGAQDGKHFQGRSYGQIVEEKLKDSAFGPEAGDALVSVDMALFRLTRLVIKGEFSGALLRKMGLDLEPAVFYGLMAVLRIRNGIGRAKPEAPTVGALAEEMNIDPSRASRIAATLIDRGYVIRAAAQDDGRKSVLELTDRGWAVLGDFFDLKWQRMMRIFSDWSDEDVVTFSRLMGRYVAGVAAPESDGT